MIFNHGSGWVSLWLSDLELGSNTIFLLGKAVDSQGESLVNLAGRKVIKQVL